jgi:hypothetical protein
LQWPKRERPCSRIVSSRPSAVGAAFQILQSTGHQDVSPFPQICAALA